MEAKHKPEIIAISLGWGVQSWALAAMVALKELPMVDFAIHSDTQWERESTYDFAKKWTPWLADHGVNVVTVDDAKQATKATTKNPGVPFFTRSEVDGIHGQLRRQCTGRWKIAPMRRHISTELKKRGLRKTPGVVEQWLGITLDEFQRMKDSDVKYIKHRFPLINMRMTRQDCLHWLEKNNLPSPGKSSCTFCPYHSRGYWRQMKREGGADWDQAVKVDSLIRKQRPLYDLFVHSRGLPLEEAVTIPEDSGQLSLLDNAPCDSGYCFI